MSLTFRGLQELEKSYRQVADTMSRAEPRAVRRAGVTIVAVQSRGITETVNLKVGTVKKAIKTVKQPTSDQPRIAFEVRGEGIALREFGARKTRRGVTVQVLRSEGRKVVQSAFLERGLGDNLQVFKRTGETKRVMKKGRYAGKLREPIGKRYGPDVLSQYIKDAIQQMGEDTWNTRLPIELARETNFALAQAGLI